MRLVLLSAAIHRNNILMRVFAFPAKMSLQRRIKAVKSLKNRISPFIPVLIAANEERSGRI